MCHGFLFVLVLCAESDGAGDVSREAEQTLSGGLSALSCQVSRVSNRKSHNYRAG